MNPQIKKHYDNLDESLNRLFSELDPLDPALLNRKPAADKWSVTEVMSHLHTSEKMSGQYIRKKLQYRDGIKPSGFQGALRSFFLRAVFGLPLKFKAPKVARPPADTGDYASLREAWKAERQSLRALLDTFPEELIDKQTFKHPLAGKMDIRQALGFFQTHFDRHYQQIQNTLKVVRTMP
jgi:uncharacterized damage-inducible protein DinB